MNTTTTLSQDFQDKFNVKHIIKSVRGGQKEVFIVELISGEKVALKIFHSFGARERKEIELYDRYKDVEGIPRILDIKDHGSTVVLVEAFIEGEPLNDLASAGFFVGNNEAIKVLIRCIIQVLQPIWEQGFVHRDLKPENIIISAEGKPIIIDFGIAKDLEASTITETGFQPNSWKFASPEQLFARKEQISYRTDFFSLGVIAYFLFHSELPFGATKDEVRQQLSDKDCSFVCTDTFELVNFCKAVFRVNPSERPRNVDQLLELLK